MLYDPRLLLSVTSLGLAQITFAAIAGGTPQLLTGTYECFEIPHTPNQWEGPRTLEFRKNGEMIYFMFPTVVVMRRGQPYPVFTTGSSSWQLVEEDSEKYVLGIIAGNEMSIARRRKTDDIDVLEIEHPSAAGPFVTKWRRVGDASEPFLLKKKPEGQAQDSVADGVASMLKRIRLLRGHVQVGYAAFCRYDGRIDELQVIGDVRTLDDEERNMLIDLLSAEDTWYLRTPDQNLRGMVGFSLDPADFKIILGGSETVLVLRIASSSGQIGLTLNDEHIKLPMIRTLPFETLRTSFDRWFPDWENITRRNYVSWRQRHEPSGSRDKPNRAPEPTPGAVTPRASSPTPK
jgi:hypothetical protein